MRTIFITGGTGYVGKRLIRKLLQRGHRITALVRQGSESRVPFGAETVIADPFQPQTFQSNIPSGSVFIQLLGVPHPSPRKARLFQEIDLRSVKASADAAAAAGVSHFIYVSVNMIPSKLMQAFQAVRSEGEDYCRSTGLYCTFLRPWYILGPGHWWPILLLPLYGIAELVPSWRQKARARALVTIHQMIAALIIAVEHNPQPLHIMEIRDIRNAVAALKKQG
ncbi:MAG: NAD(P)H-binding protein [Flavisolibacter sp.]|nr:NAD(P)H-binding protein [Flavisolibacter sp.]